MNKNKLAIGIVFLILLVEIFFLAGLINTSITGLQTFSTQVIIFDEFRTIPDLVFNEDSNYTFDISSYFTDLENDPLYYHATQTGCSELCDGNISLIYFNGWKNLFNFSTSPISAIQAYGDKIYIAKPNLVTAYNSSETFTITSTSNKILSLLEQGNLLYIGGTNGFFQKYDTQSISDFSNTSLGNISVMKEFVGAPNLGGSAGKIFRFTNGVLFPKDITYENSSITALGLYTSDVLYIGRENGTLSRFKSIGAGNYEYESVIAYGNVTITSLQEYKNKLYVGLANGSLNSVLVVAGRVDEFNPVWVQDDEIKSLTIFENELYISGRENISKFNGTRFESVIKTTIKSKNISTITSQIINGQTKLFTGTNDGEFDTFNGSTKDFVTLIPNSNYFTSTTTSISTKFYATDNKTPVDTTFSNSFRIIINSVNDFPTFSGIINSTTIDEDTNLTINIFPFFDDIETADSNLSVGLEIFFPQTANIFTYEYNNLTGNLTIIPQLNYDRHGRFKIKVWDLDGANISSNEFIIGINPMNDTIILNSNFANFTNITWYQNKPAKLNFTDYITIPSGVETLFGYIDSTCGANIAISVDTINGNYTFTPLQTFQGKCNLNLTIDDIIANTRTHKKIDLIVLDVPDAPVFNLSNKLLNLTWKEDSIQSINSQGMFFAMPKDTFTNNFINPNELLFCNFDNSISCKNYDSNNILSITNANVSLFNAGKFSSSIVLTNSSKLVYQIKNTPSTRFNNQEGTISFWFYFSWNESIPANHTLFDSTNPQGLYGFTLLHNANLTSKKIIFNWVNDSITQTNSVSANWTLKPHTWNHIAITYKKQSSNTNLAEIFINGNLAVQNSSLSFFPNLFYENLTLGRRTSSPTLNYANFALGRFDDFLILNYKKTASQIKNLFEFQYPFIQTVSNQNNIINLSTRQNWFGYEFARIKSFDILGGVNYSNIALFNITAVNDVPILINSIPNFTWNEDTSLNNVLNLSQYFSDVESSSQLTYRAIGNLSIKIAINQTTKMLSFSQPANFAGGEIVYFFASDGINETRSNMVLLNVLEVNEPTTIQIFTPASPTNYTVPIKFVLFDEEGDLASITPQFAIQSANNQHLATGNSLINLPTNLAPLSITNPTDTYLDSLYSTQSFSSENTFKVGTDGTRKFRALLKFNLPHIKPYLIKSANLKLLQVYAAGETRTIGAYQLISNWSNSQTYDTQPMSGPLIDSITVDDVYETKIFNLTSLVKLWLNSSSSNFGILLKDMLEPNSIGLHSFASSEYIGTNFPSLEITYSGLEYEFNWSSVSDINNTNNIVKINLTITNNQLNQSTYLSARTNNISINNNHPPKINLSTSKLFVTNEDTPFAIPINALIYDIDPYQTLQFTLTPTSNISLILEDDTNEGKFNITRGFDYQGAVDIATDIYNTRYIVWEDRVFGNSIISLGKFSKANQLQALVYVDASTKPQLRPKLVSDLWANKLLTWQDMRGDISTVHLALLDFDNTKLMQVNFTNSSNPKPQLNPTLATYNLSTFVVFEEHNTTSSNIIFTETYFNGIKKAHKTISVSNTNNNKNNNTLPIILHTQNIPSTSNSNNLNKNNKFVFWLQNKKQIKYIGINQSNDLTNIFNLTDNLINRDSITATIDSNGITHVAWTIENSHDLYYAKLNGTNKTFETILVNDSIKKFNPQIDTNKYNEVYITYETGLNGLAEIVYTKLNSTGQVIYSRQLTNDNLRESNPKIKIDSEDKKIIIWQTGAINDNIEGIQLSSRTGNLLMSPNLNYFGFASANITAFDGFANITTLINFTINSVNDAPVINPKLNSLGIPEDSYNDSLSLTGRATDVDSSNLTWTFTSTDNISITINSSNLKLNFSAISPNFTGTRITTFTVSDGFSSTNMSTILTVYNINDAPTQTQNIPNIYLAKNSNLTITLANYFVDIDNNNNNNNNSNSDNLTYKISPNPILNISTLINQSNSNITFSPNTNFTGTRFANIIVNDSLNAGLISNNFSIIVLLAPSKLVLANINGSTLTGEFFNLSNIFYSNINLSTISGTWFINDSTILSTSSTNSNLYSTFINTSTITNSTLTNCIVENSLVKNYLASNCVISNSVVDPVGVNYINNSNITGNSNVIQSNITNSNINNSNIYISTITNSQIQNSNTTACNSINSIIINSQINTCNASNAMINNSVLISGTLQTQFITYNASLNGSRNISDLINYAPTADFSASFTTANVGDTLTFTDLSSDPNIPGLLGDSLTYDWDFGDSTSSNLQNPIKTFNTAGDFLVDFRVTDSFGKTNHIVKLIRIVSISSGGGGGGGGGGGSGGSGGSSSGSSSTTCSSAWICDAWTPQICMPESQQTRICFDPQICLAENTKPETSRLCPNTVPITVPNVKPDTVNNQTQLPAPVTSSPTIEAPTTLPAIPSIQTPPPATITRAQSTASFAAISLVLFALTIILGISAIKGYQVVAYKVSFAGKVETIEKKARALLEKGYSRNKIRKELNMYDSALVTYALEELDYTNVEEWAERSLKKGFSPVIIREALQKTKYDKPQIDTINKRIKNFDLLKNKIETRLRKKEKKNKIINTLYQVGFSKNIVKRAIQSLINEKKKETETNNNKQNNTNNKNNNKQNSTEQNNNKKSNTTQNKTTTNKNNNKQNNNTQNNNTQNNNTQKNNKQKQQHTKQQQTKQQQKK